MEKVFKIPQIFFTCTVPAIKEGVIPTTLRRLLHMTLRLRDCISLEMAARVGP